jgi:DNA-binding transcriptional MerR regulator
MSTAAEQEWSIQDIAKAAGTTSRALRHYQAAGLLQPSRVGRNGYRYYDSASLLVLQRILLLRRLGLGLAGIGQVLQGRTGTAQALRGHLEDLLEERGRLDRLIASVRTTIDKTERGEALMPEEMFDGFDHSQYKDEVERRWGREAYARGDTWWRGLGEEGRRDWLQRSTALQQDWVAAAGSGARPDSGAAQELARRQFEWLCGANGGQEVGYGYFTGLGELYVADPRFGANYGGPAGAGFVRDAMKVYADRQLA